MYNISQVLGIAIIHSLWQGLLIYCVLKTVFVCAPSMSSVKKHNLAIAAMSAMVAWFGYTLYTEIHDYNWINSGTFRPAQMASYLNLPMGTLPRASFYETVARYLPFICAVYVAGLIINIAKLGWEWNKISRVKQTLISAVQMQQFINTFSKKLDIRKHIQLKFSELIDVPCVIGYLKPLIILPVSLSVHLSACEIESILLHELSHIKRNDYLVNIIQQFVTIILFFNPFTLLINRIIILERENGCDDLVVEKTRRPLIYARALLKLEEARRHNLQLALAATGKNFHLLNRIERIMKTEKNISGIRHLLIPVLLLAGGISCIAWFNPKMTAGNENPQKLKITAVHHSAAIANFGAVEPQNNDSKVLNIVDSASYRPLADTTKHPRKVAVIEKQDTLKEFAPADSLNEDDEPDSLVEFRATPDWNRQVKLLRKQSELIRKQFSGPQWKAQMKAIEKQSEEMRKQFNSPAWKNQMQAMRKQTEEMTRHFKGVEWKNQMAAIRKQSEELKKQFEKPEWKNQMLAMQKQSEEMRKQGEEMRKQFDSPEWKQQVEEIRKQGEEIQKQFNSPEWRQQLEEIRKQGEEIQKQFNTSEWKNMMKEQRWNWKDSVNGVHIYSPVKKLKKKKVIQEN